MEDLSFSHVMNKEGLISGVIVYPKAKIGEFFDNMAELGISVNHEQISITSDHDLEDVFNSIGRAIRIPFTMSMNFQALYEYFVELEWLTPGNYAILLDIEHLSKESCKIFHLINSISQGVCHRDYKDNVNFTLCIFV